jgi:hypothetical protein
MSACRRMRDGTVLEQSIHPYSPFLLTAQKSTLSLFLFEKRPQKAIYGRSRGCVYRMLSQEMIWPEPFSRIRIVDRVFPTRFPGKA